VAADLRAGRGADGGCLLRRGALLQLVSAAPTGFKRHHAGPRPRAPVIGAAGPHHRGALRFPMSRAACPGSSSRKRPRSRSGSARVVTVYYTVTKPVRRRANHGAGGLQNVAPLTVRGLFPEDQLLLAFTEQTMAPGEKREDGRWCSMSTRLSSPTMTNDTLKHDHAVLHLLSPSATRSPSRSPRASRTNAREVSNGKSLPRILIPVLAGI